MAVIIKLMTDTTIKEKVITEPTSMARVLEEEFLFMDMEARRLWPLSFANSALRPFIIYGVTIYTHAANNAMRMTVSGTIRLW